MWRDNFFGEVKVIPDLCYQKLWGIAGKKWINTRLTVVISTMFYCALLLTTDQSQARMPGVTVRVWDLGEEPLVRLPTVTEGQNANYYAVHPDINFRDGFKSDDEDLKDRFVGEVRAWINVPESGGYTFRLTCDDGAELYLDGKRSVVTSKEDSYSGEDRVSLSVGVHELKIPFYENGGNFSLKLEWRKPSDEKFEVVPNSSLLTEAGQTFVVSPGPKRWYYGEDPNRPGDGRPLTTVHPSMRLENFRGPNFRPPVGAMEFLPDGRLAIATWNPEGAIYLLSDLEGEVQIKKFASGLGEPLGMKWWNGDLYVVQKQEVTRLRDTDGDGEADEYYAIAGGWPASHNYHEFSFNLAERDGKFYVTTSVPLKSGVTSYTPGSNGPYASGYGPGSILEINPETGHIEVIARGARTPNGMNVGVDGELFFCDNQGSWMPGSRLNIVRKGDFYAHQDAPNGNIPAVKPVAWFPQGEIGNSPSQMVVIPDGAYRGQMLVGDVTYGGLQRVFLENVDGMYQGTVFRFSQGLEAGINRIIWGPDGCLYVGGVGADGDWNHLGHRFGLQRLRWNGKSTFEVLKLESRKDGLLVTFTEPVDEETAKEALNYSVRSWRYEPTYSYGGPKLDQAKLDVKKVELSADKRQVFLKIDDLREDRVVYLRLKDICASSSPDRLLWSTEAWMTLNKLPDILGPKFAQASTDSDLSGGAKDIIFDGHGLDRLRHGDGSAVKWPTQGDELLVGTGGDVFTRENYGDCRLHVEWMSPPGGKGQLAGNSGIKLMGRYEVQILGTPASSKPELDGAGSIYRVKPPDVNAGFGPGVWQSYTIDFVAPKWRNGRKESNARITLWWNGVLVQDNVEITKPTGAQGLTESEGELPILFQSHASDASGPVRFRNVWVVRH